MPWKGRGYYASEASHGRELGYYDGEEVTLQEYNELDEYTGLRHTLEVGGRMINGIHGATGLQYANTSRDGAEANNAKFQQGTAVVRVNVTGGVVRGQPVLLPYDWTAAAWAEIDSRVIGMCAYEERGAHQGMGEDGGTYIIEIASALRRGGLATQLIREARRGWARGKGRLELQVHMSNHRARGYYERLGMRGCARREEEEGAGGQREGRDDGSSLYEPREGYQMMRVAARELEGALRERAERREPVTGVEFIRVQGVQGLRGAGVLQGVRAMAARVYAGEEWYVHDDGGTGRIECLYERAKRGAGAVQFVVARLTTEDRWASDGRRAARAGEVQERRAMGGEGGTATARSAADVAGGSAEADDGGEGAGSDTRATGPQGPPRQQESGRNGADFLQVQALARPACRQQKAELH